MSFSKLLNLLFAAFGLVETADAELIAGATASTPAVVIGSIGGKPLYGKFSASTNPDF